MAQTAKFSQSVKKTSEGFPKINPYNLTSPGNNNGGV
jgi:hypothetical protein